VSTPFGPNVLQVFWTLVVLLALICLTVSFGRLSSVVSESPVHSPRMYYCCCLTTCLPLVGWMNKYLMMVTKGPLLNHDLGVPPHAGWMICEQETIFHWYSYTIANPDHQLYTNHPHPSTSLVVTKCITYLVTYIATIVSVPYLLTYDTYPFT
jgi:hypothetical protein